MLNVRVYHTPVVNQKGLAGMGGGGIFQEDFSAELTTFSSTESKQGFYVDLSIQNW